jgi:tetratricopeptide (TPR) repeat protein
MNFILPLLLIVSGVIGQNASDAESRYEAHRRAGLSAFLYADYKQAESDFNDALTEARSFGSSDIRVVTALTNLAIVYARTGRLAEAEELLQKSATMLRTSDPNHDLCVVLNILGEVYIKENRPKDAERTLAVALSLARNGRDSADRVVSDILGNLGGLQLRQGKYRQAEQSFQKAVEIHQKNAAAANLNFAETLNALGTLYGLQSRYSKAEEVLQRSLKITEELLPPWHPDLAFLLENLAVVENKLHHFDASETYFRRTIAIQTQKVAMSRPGFLAIYADTLRNLDKQEEADALLAQMKRLLDEERFIIRTNRPLNK